jgi:hypothetical protein
MPDAQKITNQGGTLSVPDHAVIPFIEGDGTGPPSGGGFRCKVVGVSGESKTRIAENRCRRGRQTPPRD